MRYIYVFLEQSSKWSENNEHLNEKKLEKPLKYQIEIELKSKTKSSLFSQSMYYSKSKIQRSILQVTS